MADHDTPERFEGLARALLGAFTLIQGLLAALPLSIVIPDLEWGDDGDAKEVLMAFDRARNLVDDEPIPDGLKWTIERLMLDWFVAYEMLTLTKVAGPAPWRMDCAEFALLRMEAWIQMIEIDYPDGPES